MSWRFPGRQWRSRVRALGGAHMAPPLELGVDVIPYPGAPAAWTYPSSSLSLNVGVPMTPLAATVTSGAPYGWHVLNTGAYPTTLPAGLAIDSSTGTISGTPTTVTPTRDYLPTSLSEGGPTSRRLTIVVNP